MDQQLFNWAVAALGALGGFVLKSVWDAVKDLQRADLAEFYAGSHQIEAGTVVEFGGDHEVQICNSHMSTLIAGIVTTDPAYLMNAGIDCLYPVAIALQGRVPAKVLGPIKRGDMLVSTNNGYAIACSAPAIGTVLGKALKNFDGVSGVIEIMVGKM